MRFILFIAAALALIVTGCEHDHGSHDHGDEVDQVAEGCKHLEFGPEVAVDADPAASAAIASVHTRYDLTLAADGDRFQGQLTYTSSGEMHYLMLSAAAELAVTDSAGAVVEPSMVESSPASCERAASVYHVMLPEGEYSLGITGAESAELSLVVHVAGHDHDHAH